MDLDRAFLATGKYAEAQEYCEKAIEMQVSGSRYQAALTLGIVYLRLGDSPAAVGNNRAAPRHAGALARA